MSERRILQKFLDLQDGTRQRLDQKAESQPIFREGKPPTVLCVHGFTGVPREVRLAADAASALGLATLAPLLPGHGTCPADLAPCRFPDWVDGVRAHLLKAAQQGRVIVVGLSLGSLIATQLALELPGHICGLVLMSNAFWLRQPHPDFSLAAAARVGLRDFFIPKAAPDILDPAARASHVCYMQQPLHASVSLREAGVRLREELFKVHCPTLLLHGADDQVAPVSNAWKAAALLGTEDRRVIVYPRSHHILTRDLEREQVAKDLTEFYRRFS